MTQTTTTTTTTKLLPASDLSPSLALQFVAYIDRSEKTTKTYINNLKQFFLYLQENETRQPNRETIINYRDFLAKNYKANTTKQYLQSVKAFFAWAAAAGYYPNIAANVHTPKIKQNKHLKEALTAEDVEIIEADIIRRNLSQIESAKHSLKDTDGREERATEAGKRLLALYTLSVNCGLRCIELSRANIKDFETVGGVSYLYIWGKGHSQPDQRKALAPQVAEILADYINTRKPRPTANAPLFVATGNRSGGQRLAPGTIGQMLKHALVNAGYNSERITAHSLRHTAGTSVQTLTNNLYLTQQYMRHENPATTEIYLHCNNEREEQATACKLYEFYHKNSGPKQPTTTTAEMLHRSN